MLKYVVMRRRTDCTNMWSGALASDFIEQTLLNEAKKGRPLLPPFGYKYALVVHTREYVYVRNVAKSKFNQP